MQDNQTRGSKGGTFYVILLVCALIMILASCMGCRSCEVYVPRGFVGVIVINAEQGKTVNVDAAAEVPLVP